MAAVSAARYSRAAALQWLILLALSAALIAVLEALRLPAAFLLGPMAAAIVLARVDATVRVPAGGFLAAQAVVGCLIARTIPAAVLLEIVRDWPLYLSAVVSVIAASAGLGWLLMRWRILPGTTALWGLSPGAATAMMVLADAYGGDIRLVAFMQYLRVLLVSLVAILVAWALTPGGGGAPTPVVWFPPLAPVAFAETLGLIALGVVVAPRIRMPAGSLMLPLIVTLVLQDTGWLTVELPPWLLVASYALIGWSTGLRFTRPILAHALRALPQVVAAIVILIAICAGLAALLTWIAGVDPLTAYLAMSPGGADATAIIATSSPVDLPFVMAMQTTRFFLVLLLGPRLARLIARRARRTL